MASSEEIQSAGKKSDMPPIAPTHLMSMNQLHSTRNILEPVCEDRLIRNRKSLKRFKNKEFAVSSWGLKPEYLQKKKIQMLRVSSIQKK